MPLIRRPPLLILYAAVFLTLASFYFFYYPIPGFWARSGELGRAFLFMFLLASVGRSILRRSPFDGPGGPGEAGRGELLLLSIGVGAIPVVLGFLLLGVAGHFDRRSLLLLSAALGVLAWRDAQFWVSVLVERMSPGRPPWIPTAGILGGGAVFALGLLCAFAPPTYYDSLVYHLALPAKYLQEGRVGFVPYNHYSHFPQNMEMVFGWFLAMSSDVSAQVFNVFLAALTAIGLWVVFRPAKGAPPSFRWDVFLFLTAPCLLLLSTETYVETATAFWTSLSVWAAYRGLKDGRRAWFALAGALGGFLAGIKYTGVITPALLTVLVGVWPGRRSWRDRALDGFLVAAVSLAVFSPWLVKNFVFTGGNPFFPFLPSLFPARNVYLYQESAEAYFQVLSEYKGASALLIELFKMPFRLTTQAESFGGGFDVTGDLGWALPLLLLPLGLLTLRSSAGFRFLGAYTLAHLFLWASLRPVLRFLFPVFPLVCALSGQGLSALLRPGGPWARRAAAGVVGLFTLSGAVLFYWVERVRDPFPVVLGLSSREEYLSRKLDYYPWMSFMDRELPLKSRVLFVGDQRSYYCPRPYVAPMALLPQPLKAWAEEAETGEDLRQSLVRRGFTHLFLNRREAKRLEGYRVLDFTPRGTGVFEDLLKASTAIQSTEAAALYALERP